MLFGIAGFRTKAGLLDDGENLFEHGMSGLDLGKQRGAGAELEVVRGAKDVAGGNLSGSLDHERKQGPAQALAQNHVQCGDLE